MRSIALLDRHEVAADHARVSDLLVLWQHPETRELVPIGRFQSTDGGSYTFRYTRAAAEIPDFRPLPGLPDLLHRYEDDHIPAVFRQRVMDRDRPGFNDYAQMLGLDPANATPWEQIVESGGHRAGDTLQFMPVPMVRDGRVFARFLVNGIRHIPSAARTFSGRTIEVTALQQEHALRSLAIGDTVLIESEQGTPEDLDACLVTAGGVPVGWVPRALSRSVRALGGLPLEATVHRVAPPGTPPHVRLVLDLNVPAPAGFQFDRHGDWEPLAQ